MDVTTNNDNLCRGFVDEDFSNFSIVSKKEKKKRKEASVSNVNATYGIDPSKAKDCGYLQVKLTQVQNAITNELGKNPSKTTLDRVVNPMRDVESSIKNAMVENGCEDKKLEADRKAEEKRTLEGLKAAAQIGSGDTTSEPTPTSKNTKYVMYGVGGLLLLIVGISILRR